MSLIIPVYNEQECILSVVKEATRVLDGLSQPYEVIVINDGSTDQTAALLIKAQGNLPTLRVLTITPNSGQSAALGVGLCECRGRIAVLMDGDGQNDPRDIPALLGELNDCDACCGYRASRRDTWRKRLGSRVANAVRRSILHDGIIDTGCSLKAIKSEFLRDLPMALRGMHRFLPALLGMRGAEISQVPVNHRPRSAGRSKYTNFGRLTETVWDLWAVRWMQKRYRRFCIKNEG